jgi:hypothetical protein
LAATEQPISYAQDIKPSLFREGDRESMSSAFDLWSYDDVVQKQRRHSRQAPGRHDAL